MIKDLESTYGRCDADGIYKVKEEVDMDLIRSLADNGERGLKFIKKASRTISKSSTDWTFVFREYYEALRGHIEAFMLFGKVDASNHQCKNAYICFKHPELELDWQFLETARLKRNAINYKGQMLKFEDWKALQINFDLHISKLSREIKKRLDQS